MDLSSVNFDGIRYDPKGNISFLVFSRGNNGALITIEVPVSSDVATRVMKYMERLLPPISKTVERGNDEPST